MSKRTWPENAWPTPEQWLDWLLTLPREQQLGQARRAINDAQTAEACLLGNHYGLNREAQRVRAWAIAASEDAHRNRLAWYSARRRANNLKGDT